MANILKTEKKVAVISMLAEGTSIRAVERITGVNQNTIMSLNRRVGDACAKIMDEKMRDLNCRNLEIDEIWGFIGAKRKNAERAGAYDDVWTFIALDADTKLIPLSTQRVYYNRGRLSQERIALLQKLNFDWTGGKVTWEMRFAELKAFKERFGHTRVSVRWAENPLLGRWASAQRHKKRKRKISREHEALLDSIGFEGGATNVINKKEFWNRQIQAILRFKAEHKHFVVPRHGKENTSLAVWMSDQRSKYKKGTIDPELKTQLDAIGFPWISETKPGASQAWKSIYDKHWHEMFKRFKQYIALHGSTNVIATDDETAKLKGWVKSQKDARRDDRLHQEKIQLLDRLGIVWAKPRKNVVVHYHWHEMFEQFKKYMSTHGNPNIVLTDNATAKLKAWVKSLKDTRRRNHLSQEKISALDQVGFVWAKPRKKP
jgi:hypothetical protein